VIENRPGAIGVIGTAEAARAAPDGHTILMTTNSTLAAAESLFRKLQYDPVRDFAPIMLISKTSMLLPRAPGVSGAQPEGLHFPRALEERRADGRLRLGRLAVSIAKLKAGGGFAAVDVAL